MFQQVPQNRRRNLLMKMNIQSMIEKGILIVDKNYIVKLELPDSELSSHGGSLEDFVIKKEGEFILSYVKESTEPFMLDTTDAVVRHPMQRSSTITRTITMYIFSSVARGIMEQEFEKYSEALVDGNKPGYTDWMKEEGMWFPKNNEEAITGHKRQSSFSKWMDDKGFKK